MGPAGSLIGSRAFSGSEKPPREGPIVGTDGDVPGIFVRVRGRGGVRGGSDTQTERETAPTRMVPVLGTNVVPQRTRHVLWLELPQLTPPPPRPTSSSLHSLRRSPTKRKRRRQQQLQQRPSSNRLHRQPSPIHPPPSHLARSTRHAARGTPCRRRPSSCRRRRTSISSPRIPRTFTPPATLPSNPTIWPAAMVRIRQLFPRSPPQSETTRSVIRASGRQARARTADE